MVKCEGVCEAYYHMGVLIKCDICGKLICDICNIEDHGLFMCGNCWDRMTNREEIDCE